MEATPTSERLLATLIRPASPAGYNLQLLPRRSGNRIDFTLRNPTDPRPLESRCGNESTDSGPIQETAPKPKSSSP